jgi:galactose mutarotase-like enzyme
MPDNAWTTIGSTELTAQINPLGAELSVLRDRNGLDLLWDGNPSIWSGRAPLLFPIIGALAGGVYRLESRAYPLSRHGFARGKLFEMVAANAAAATFRLKMDAESFAVYPFDFELSVHFAISAAALTIITEVRNDGDVVLPASFGYHPAFRWPLPFGQARASHYVEFECDEPAPIRRLNAAGLMGSALHPTPVSQRRLLLNDALFRDDVIIFDAIHSRSVTYGADHGPRLSVSYPTSPYLGIWTKPNADFICIEPWNGVADPDGFSGGFQTKPGVFLVAAGEAVKIEMTIALIG